MRRSDPVTGIKMLEVSLKEGKIDEREILGPVPAPRIGGIPCRCSLSVGVGAMLHERDAAGPISESCSSFERRGGVRGGF